MCAENNMTVANCTTPANYFHLLRRQALSSSQRPLIVMTPKSLLRHKAAVSSVADFTQGRFSPVLDDPGVRGEPINREAVTRVLLCSGKVAYDLGAERDKRAAGEVALLRVEQIYPLPAGEINDLLATFPNATDLVWVQEEPANMGAWPFMALHLPDELADGRQLRRVSRDATASPATGSHSVHDREQQELVADALSGLND